MRLLGECTHRYPAVEGQLVNEASIDLIERRGAVGSQSHMSILALACSASPWKFGDDKGDGVCRFLGKCCPC